MLKDRTLREILEDPLISDAAKDAIRNRDLSKEELYDWTLREIAEKIGWADLERGLSRLLEIASRGDYYYRLYDRDECEGDPQKETANIVFFPSDDPAADEKPFIMMVSGGGFVNVWNLTEGWPVAKLFNDYGYHVVILTYQVGVPASALRAMEDMARAFDVIRLHKDRFRIDPERYITCGFSAGGYVICLWNTEKGYEAYRIPKPEACFPVYPVTSYKIMLTGEWDEDEKEEVGMNSVGCSMEEAANSCFEIIEHVKGFPPTAVFVTSEDDLVDPENSRQLAKALTDEGIPCRLEEGPTGGHGFADGIGMCMEGWPERAVKWYESL